MDLDTYRNEISRKILITKKCRIELSEKHLHNCNFFQGLLVYYAVLLVVFSLLDIFYWPQDGTVFLLILSIMLTVLSVYVNSLNLLDKYYNLKTHYIALDGLISELRITTSIQEIRKIEITYQQLLSTVENHGFIENVKVRLNSFEEVEWIKKGDCKNGTHTLLKFRWLLLIATAKDYSFKAVLILIPFLPLLILIKSLSTVQS